MSNTLPRPAAEPRAATLTGALRRAAAADVERAGLRLLDRQERASWHPWQEIRQRALAVARGLLELGLGRQERVALIYPTGLEFFDAFFGTLLAGGVPVPLYPPVRLGRLDEYHLRTAAMLRACRARFVLADGRVRRLLGNTIALAGPPAAGGPAACLTLDQLPATAGAAATAYLGEGVATGRSSGADDDPCTLDEEDLALVQFSSGTTTDDPKPVALTHRALLAQSRIIEGCFVEPGPGEHQAGVSWLPLYHDMGLVGCVLPALDVPGPLTLLGPEHFVARPAAWLRAISTYRATVSPAPHFAYGLCLARIRDEELAGVDLSCWRLALDGSEPVTAGVLRQFAARFARWGLRPEALTPVYGLSEAALAVTFSDPRRPFVAQTFSRQALAEGRAVVEPGGVELVAVGEAVPGVELRLCDSQRRVVPAGTVGRIWLRSPSMMAGYLDRPEQTARALVDGWLDSGDLGFLHEEQLFLTGRAKDLLILRGRNHAPQEVEQAVDHLPGVRTGCAAAVSYLPEGQPGERLVLLVEHRLGLSAAAQATLADACRSEVRLATGLTCDVVQVLAPGTLPRTSSGKIRRGEALLRYRAGTLRPPASVTLLRLAGYLLASWVGFARSRLRARARGA